MKKINAALGLAVDYGSTTIVMQLIDTSTGQILAEEKETNGQRKFGTDILTRITYTMENPEHRSHLQKATTDTFHKLFHRLSQKTNVDVKNCHTMIISGNTTMIHFLLKLDASTIFFAPYEPENKDPGWVNASDIGLDFQGAIYIIPAVSNYVGGDIVSGLLTLDFYKKAETSMFFDIGTNGELVIGNNNWILAGAGAAGPALEGYISRFGMQAKPGAIDSVKIENNKLTYTTIDHEKPIGICGSGIIDLLAQMRIHGWMNIAGALEPSASEAIIYLEKEKQYAVVYATEEESGINSALYFSQTDIHQYLDTKAAAFTMIDSLLSSVGLTEQDIDHCYLTGAFSAHSNLESAITLGIFPDLPREKYSCIRNSSLDGARTLLLDPSKSKDITFLLENIFCVQFASIPDFLIRMQAAKFIPHTDMERFPSIAQILS